MVHLVFVMLGEDSTYGDVTRVGEENERLLSKLGCTNTGEVAKASASVGNSTFTGDLIRLVNGIPADDRYFAPLAFRFHDEPLDGSRTP